ncbi:MAG: hypothetical protein IKS21_00085 [Oscillospiraceae bacterium]|nr:hypothetical protein [Oscillospiraceae bacterium]
MKQGRTDPAAFGIAAGILLFLLFPSAVSDGVRSGLTLCARVLIPTLFPVSVLTGCLLRMGVARFAATGLLARLGRPLGLSGVGMLPFLFGLLGGFPLGAQMLAELSRNGSLRREEALRATVLCNNAGPGFLIGALGSGILGRPELGAALLLIQLLSAWTAALLLRKGAQPCASPSKVSDGKCLPFAQVFFPALETAAGAMLRLTATVAFFSALIACASRLLPLERLSLPVRSGVTGFLELSSGAALLSEMDGASAFVLAAAMTAWGGLCVHAQTLQAFSAAELPSGRYFAAKLLQAVLAGLLALAVTQFDRVPFLSAGGLLLGFGTIFVFLRLSEKIHWKSEKPVV